MEIHELLQKLYNLKEGEKVHTVAPIRKYPGAKRALAVKKSLRHSPNYEFVRFERRRHIPSGDVIPHWLALIVRKRKP